MQAISAKNSGLTLTVGVEGTQVSQQPCKQTDLLEDTPAQAEQVATAPGISSGPILSIGSVGFASFPTPAVVFARYTAAQNTSL